MFEIRIARERRQGYGSRRQVRDARDVYEAFRAHFESMDREQFLAVILDGKSRILGFNLVSTGALLQRSSILARYSSRRSSLMPHR